MNEQANKILADLLQKASNGIDAAVSFSQAQIPDVIHQLLMWNFTKSIVMSVLAIMTIYPVVRLVRRSLRRIPDGVYLRGEGYSWDEGKPKYKPGLVWDSKGDISPVVMLPVAFLALWLMWVLGSITDLTWLKIWIAPKLYLIEYAAHLVK